MAGVKLDRGARSGRSCPRSRPLPPERIAMMLPGPLLVSLLLLLCDSAPNQTEAIREAPAPAPTRASSGSAGEPRDEALQKGESASKSQGTSRSAGATKTAGAPRAAATPAGRIRAPKG